MQEEFRPEFERFEESPFGEEIALKESPVDKLKAFLEEAQEKARPILEQHGKKIVLGIFALLVLYFFYWFFVGSFFDVTLRIENTEGSLVDSVSGQLLTREGGLVEEFYGGLIQARVRAGDYQLKLTPQEIYDVRVPKYFSVDDSGNVFPPLIVLEKKLDLELTKSYFPPVLSAGEEAQFEIARYYNNSSREAKVQVELGDGKFQDLFEVIEFQPSILIVPAGAEVPLTVRVRVKQDVKVSNERDGDLVTGLLKVKFLKESNPANQEINFRLYPAPNLKIAPSELNYGTITAGKSGSKSIKITNLSSFEVKEVNLKTEIDYAIENSEIEVLSWLSWNLCPGENTCSVSVGAKGSETLKLIIDVPEEAFGEDVRGRVIASAPTWEKSSDILFTIRALEQGEG